MNALSGSSNQQRSKAISNVNLKYTENTDVRSAVSCLRVCGFSEERICSQQSLPLCKKKKAIVFLFCSHKTDYIGAQFTAILQSDLLHALTTAHIFHRQASVGVCRSGGAVSDCASGQKAERRVAYIGDIITSLQPSNRSVSVY